MRFLWQFASFSGIMLFLSCVAPTIAFLSVNVEHFTNRQIRNAVMAVMAFGLIAWFVIALISEPINSLLPFYWFGLQVSDILSCFDIIKLQLFKSGNLVPFHVFTEKRFIKIPAGIN